MGVIVTVIERLQALGALAAGQLVRISALEEARRQLHQPLGVYRTHLHWGTASGGCGEPSFANKSSRTTAKLHTAALRAGVELLSRTQLAPTLMKRHLDTSHPSQQASSALIVS